jgi:hypothetical protein
VGAATPAFPGRLVYSQFREGLPPTSVLRVPPLCYVSFFVVLFGIQFFSLFSLCGGHSIQGVMLIWPRVVCESTVLLSSAGVLHLSSWEELASGSAGALLVSPFNMECGCYARAGGVEESEESEFCLFSVVFLVRCISSVSPRFYFRKKAFCFLPLVVILESLLALIRLPAICTGQQPAMQRAVLPISWV